MIIFGLAGPIGSGKSMVLKILKNKGAYPVFADKIIKKLYQPHEKGWQLFKKKLSPDFFHKNKKINTEKLADLIFSNISELKKIEKMIHPLVLKETKKEIIKAKKINKKIIVIEAAKFEKNSLGDLTDKIILIKCPRKTIIARNEKHNPKILIKILKSFHPPSRVDFVINNNKNLKDLKKETELIYKKIKEKN